MLSINCIKKHFSRTRDISGVIVVFDFVGISNLVKVNDYSVSLACKRFATKTEQLTKSCEPLNRVRLDACK